MLPTGLDLDPVPDTGDDLCSSLVTPRRVVASDESYTITLSNNRTEKAAMDYVTSSDPHFLVPSLEGRKRIMELLEIPARLGRAFDLIRVEGHVASESQITVSNASLVTLVELKTTKKCLPECPKGFFFGATENEFELARLLGDKYLFCFVSLHPDSLGFSLLTESELQALIRTKRTQYQINL